ncbi:MAG: hypothetical protein RIR88_695 [Actinomycetota bacterium]
MPRPPPQVSPAEASSWKSFSIELLRRTAVSVLRPKIWGVCRLALALLVTRVIADDHHVSVAADDLALVTDLLDAGVDLHCFSFFAVFVPVSSREPAVTSQQFLFVAVDDAATGEVVWAQLYDDLVLREDADVVLAHLARNVGKDLVSVG